MLPHTTSSGTCLSSSLPWLDRIRTWEHCCNAKSNSSKTGQTSCFSWTEAAVRGRQEAGGNKCQSSHGEIFPDFIHQRKKKLTWPVQGPQSIRCQPDLSAVISAPTPAVQLSPGQLDWEFYTLNGPFQPQYITSFSQMFLSAWGRNSHPSNTLVPSLLATCCNYLLWHSISLDSKQAHCYFPQWQHWKRKAYKLQQSWGCLHLSSKEWDFFLCVPLVLLFFLRCCGTAPSLLAPEQTVLNIYHSGGLSK